MDHRCSSEWTRPCLPVLIPSHWICSANCSRQASRLTFRCSLNERMPITRALLASRFRIFGAGFYTLDPRDIKKFGDEDENLDYSEGEQEADDEAPDYLFVGVDSGTLIIADLAHLPKLVTLLTWEQYDRSLRDETVFPSIIERLGGPYFAVILSDSRLGMQFDGDGTYTILAERVRWVRTNQPPHLTEAATLVFSRLHSASVRALCLSAAVVMRTIRQRNTFDCGVAVVATLAELPYDAVLDRLITGLSSSSPLPEIVVWRSLEDATQASSRIENMWAPWHVFGDYRFPQSAGRRAHPTCGRVAALRRRLGRACLRSTVRDPDGAKRILGQGGLGRYSLQPQGGDLS